MHIRTITISAAFAVALTALPLSTAEAQYYPPFCSPFPLAWPFCAAGAILTTAAIIVTVPFRALTGAPPFGYYGPPYYPPPPPFYPPPPYYAPPPPNYYGPH